MNEETRGQRTSGRSVEVVAFGDSVTEIDMAALAQTADFFGDGVAAEVVPDYTAYPVRTSSAMAAEPGAEGKSYYASVTVRES